MFLAESLQTDSTFDTTYTWELPVTGFRVVRSVSGGSATEVAKASCYTLYPVLRELIDKLSIELELLDDEYTKQLEDFVFRVWKDAREQFSDFYMHLQSCENQPRQYCEYIQYFETWVWQLVPPENFKRRIVALELVDAIIKSNKLMLRALAKIDGK